MRPALLLVDLQADYLARPGMIPERDVLVGRAAELLQGCRSARIPVLHVHTVVRADGSNRMPHWRRNNVWSCVEKSPGVLPPATLAPKGDEPVFHKQFFSAFGNADLGITLAELRVDTLIVAGLFLHACIRTTVLDAYESGYQIWVAADAVGTTDQIHGQITRQYLQERAADFLETQSILKQIGAQP